MVEEELTALYKKTKVHLAKLVEDMTFSNFYRALQSGRRAYSLKNTEIDKTIDTEWVDAIKEAVPHIDAIVNNPRKYMKRETEVVPVEKAKAVDAESVRHLAAHTNLINSVEGGRVRPNKILTAYNDESLELYENRFVVTLINRVSQFIDRRYFLLGAGGNEFSSSIAVSGEFEQAGEETEYGLHIKVHQGAQYFEGGVSEQVYADLFMIRKYVNSFKYSPFVKALSSCAPVRPPVMKTNLLVKEPNYAACLKLWDFMDGYIKAGYKIEVKDSAPQLTRDEIDELDMLQVLQYLALKNLMADFDDRRRPMRKCEKKVIRPTLDEYQTGDKERDEYETGRKNKDADELQSEDVLPKTEFTVRDAIDGSAQRDVEEAVRNAVIHALRKEQVKEEMRREEERERELMLTGLVKEALDYNRTEEREAQKRKEAAAAQAIREALKSEQERLKREKREADKRERALEKVLQNQLQAYKEDERARKDAEKWEQREQERLISAILSDMLKIEEERRYVEESPVVMFGHERMPVPVESQRMPIDKSVADLYYGMFTPPPTLTDEDWEELEKLKAKKRRPRRRIAENAVFTALKKALALERKRERELYQKKTAEENGLQLLDAAAALDNAPFMNAEASGVGSLPCGENLNGLPCGAQGTESRGSEQSGGNPEDSANNADGACALDNVGGGAEDARLSGGGRAKDGEPDDNRGGQEKGSGKNLKAAEKETPQEDKIGRGLPIPAEEERLSWWRRLINALFFWWRKKK